MTHKLTKAIVGRMQAGAKEQIYFDEEVPGFAVKVLPSGRRVFFFQYRHGGRGGRQRRITLGEFRDPPLIDTDTVDGARRKAAEHRAATVRGEDPFAALQTAKAAEIEAARREAQQEKDPDPKTVADLATEYLARWASKKRDGGTADKRALEKDVLPEIGALAIENVTRRDIVRLLDKITDRGAPIMANRVHALVHRVFNFGLARGLLTISPVVKIGRSAETPRKRHLSVEEIPVFWRALDAETGEPGADDANDHAACEANIKALLRFMLLTARRRSEALFINICELDLKQGLWCIPEDRTKNGLEFLLPLPPAALKILEEVGADERTGYYFISGRTGQPYEPRSIDHACRDLFLPRTRKRTNGKEAPPKPVLAGMERIVPHDLRRTASTHMRAIGISREDVKFLLGHAERDVLGKHYDLYEGLAEKRRALELWTGYIADVLSPKPSNVTSINRAVAG